MGYIIRRIGIGTFGDRYDYLSMPYRTKMLAKRNIIFEKKLFKNSTFLAHNKIKYKIIKL